MVCRGKGALSHDGRNLRDVAYTIFLIPLFIPILFSYAPFLTTPLGLKEQWVPFFSLPLRKTAVVCLMVHKRLNTKVSFVHDALLCLVIAW